MQAFNVILFDADNQRLKFNGELNEWWIKLKSAPLKSNKLIGKIKSHRFGSNKEQKRWMFCVCVCVGWIFFFPFFLFGLCLKEKVEAEEETSRILGRKCHCLVKRRSSVSLVISFIDALSGYHWSGIKGSIGSAPLSHDKPRQWRKNHRRAVKHPRVSSAMSPDQTGSELVPQEAHQCLIEIPVNGDCFKCHFYGINKFISEAAARNCSSLRINRWMAISALRRFLQHFIISRIIIFTKEFTHLKDARYAKPSSVGNSSVYPRLQRKIWFPQFEAYFSTNWIKY